MASGHNDYQPLRNEGLDSPTDIRTGHFNDHEDEDDQHEDHNISEAQELVGPQEREEATDTFHRRILELEGEGEKSSQTAAEAAEWSMRIRMFLYAAMLGVSTHFTLHLTSPLKDVLKENMSITNTQFSLLQSSLTLSSTFVPLFGGLVVERYGTGPSSIVFTIVVIIGQALVVVACWARSIKLMIIGYCLFGIGASPITIIQETIWVRYFRKTSLALGPALGLTIGKLAGFAALVGAYPLSTLKPFGFVTPFLVSLIISMLTLVLNIGFLLMLKKPKEGSDTMTKITILLKEKRPHLGWREVYGFSSMFWSLLTISFWVGASWNPFMHQASNIIKHRYGFSDERAAWEASIMLAVPLIAYPFLGTFIDYAGKRAWLLLMTAGLLVLTHILLMMPYPTIAIPPTIPMLLFALSLSFGTLSIVTSMPILTKHVPTGLGLHRSIDNIGATLFGTVAGMMQDSVNTGVDEESKTENFFDRLYHHFFPKKVNLIQQEKEDLQLIGLFLFVAIAAFAASAVFVWGDYHWRDGKDGKTGLVNGVYGRQAKTPSRQRSRRRWTRTRVANVARGEDGVAVLEPFTMEPVFDLEDEPDAEELSMADISSNATRPRPTDGDYSSEDPHFLDTHSLDQTTEWSRLHPQADEEDQSADDEESLDESGENRFGVRIDSGDDDIPLYKKRQAHFWILVWSMMLLVSWVVFAVGLAK